MKIVLATSNPGKIVEIRTILSSLGIDIVSPEDLEGKFPEIVEDGDTFEANAQKKALEVARWAGMPALADDSGLVVPILGGDPGVHSSRYAGEDGDNEANMALLLERMKAVPEAERLAYFVCVLALASPDGRTWQTRGRVDGLITFEKHGKAGFGYDPIFFYIPEDKTFSQMRPEEKNRFSHRHRALEDFGKMWPEIAKELETV
ncbi:MAG: RdgB/HAM1 family non-canonical purine NTP pyrophosphatase [bacterium]|nr:RdgB/HAM1 family non-canonical purine NTP pyrophosphatase [bacterium]MDT8366226.1 RdgB/HAM1 family non-canonical purine NTP pyrophosphatase [bacterium]